MRVDCEIYLLKLFCKTLRSIIVACLLALTEYRRVSRSLKSYLYYYKLIYSESSSSTLYVIFFKTLIKFVFIYKSITKCKETLCSTKSIQLFMLFFQRFMEIWNGSIKLKYVFYELFHFSKYKNYC